MKVTLMENKVGEDGLEEFWLEILASLLGLIKSFYSFWSSLDQFDPVWTNLIQFEPIWSNLDKCSANLKFTLTENKVGVDGLEEFWLEIQASQLGLADLVQEYIDLHHYLLVNLDVKASANRHSNYWIEAKL